jgi:hypothetical protein
MSPDLLSKTKVRWKGHEGRKSEYLFVLGGKDKHMKE